MSRLEDHELYKILTSTIAGRPLSVHNPQLYLEISDKLYSELYDDYSKSKDVEEKKRLANDLLKLETIVSIVKSGFEKNQGRE